jgi:carboxylesterase type B
MGQPIIGVSINYRLQAFGFLHGTDVLKAGVTNLGFRDQRLALHWIQENISPFGGDPSKVTIWGVVRSLLIKPGTAADRFP